MNFLSKGSIAVNAVTGGPQYSYSLFEAAVTLDRRVGPVRRIKRHELIPRASAGRSRTHRGITWHSTELDPADCSLCLWLSAFRCTCIPTTAARQEDSSDSVPSHLGQETGHSPRPVGVAELRR
jgi:hypothetical protein